MSHEGESFSTWIDGYQIDSSSLLLFFCLYINEEIEKARQTTCTTAPTLVGRLRISNDNGQGIHKKLNIIEFRIMVIDLIMINRDFSVN